MKTNAIVRIIIYSIVIVMLLSILGVGIAFDRLQLRWDLPFSEGEGTVSSTGTADAGAVRNLSIDWAAGTITIRPADVTQLTLTETCGDNDEPMVWLQSGDTLKVASVKDEKIFHVGSVPSKDLLIEVPRDWTCTVLEIDTAAADLIVESMTIEKVDFDGASGKFNFTDCTVHGIEMDTASGDVSFTGSLDFLDCDAASADCEIVLNNHPDYIEMDMASGNLDLTLPGDCGFTAVMSSLSGRFNSDFPTDKAGDHFTSGDGSCRIEINAMSGDVYIHKGA